VGAAVQLACSSRPTICLKGILQMYPDILAQLTSIELKPLRVFAWQDQLACAMDWTFKITCKTSCLSSYTPRDQKKHVATWSALQRYSLCTCDGQARLLRKVRSRASHAYLPISCSTSAGSCAIVRCPVQSSEQQKQQELKTTLA